LFQLLGLPLSLLGLDFAPQRAQHLRFLSPCIGIFRAERERLLKSSQRFLIAILA
jgi:hypothetical protein